MVVAVQTEPTFRTERPRELFRVPIFEEDFRQYDVSPDGQRLLMIRETEEQPEPLQIVVVPDWPDELTHLVSAGKQ